MLKESFFGNVDCTNPRACYAESKRLGAPEVSKVAAIVIATDWSEYRELESFELGSVFIFDCRRLLNPNKFEAEFFWGPGLGPRSTLPQTQLLDQAANDRGVGLITPMREPLVHGLEPEFL